MVKYKSTPSAIMCEEDVDAPLLLVLPNTIEPPAAVVLPPATLETTATPDEATVLPLPPVPPVVVVVVVPDPPVAATVVVAPAPLAAAVAPAPVGVLGR